MAIPSSSGMLNLARFSSPSPRQRERSWMEYFEENTARAIRSNRDSATVPDSRALLGKKPQQVAEKTMASNNGANSSSKGQFMKTDVAGLTARFPTPKCSRCLCAGLLIANQLWIEGPGKLKKDFYDFRNCSTSATQRVGFFLDQVEAFGLFSHRRFAALD
jgi:hypothetical protein